MVEMKLKDQSDKSVRPISARSRTFIVVVDGSDESRAALRFAAARAVHVEGGRLTLFHAIQPGEFQHWVAVADRMREEAYEEAVEMMNDVADRVEDYCGAHPEYVIVEGDPKEALRTFIEKTEDLFGLVLASNPDGNPGPLVDYFSGPLVADLKCPLIIIPGNLTDDEIDSLA
ncbi:universal stress protein [Temperatibacter marinus]|uniref:Universal stress protein n=1 Tax=Temperatibacter marinus TaxID=1456591 RepID=A0AA52EJL4_9PROT|nr:universal stress protein [Temperatibacter marinus]WND03694.1 universal stress protein [Temperatibacter marinus]